jgi:hypothetical protein
MNEGKSDPIYHSSVEDYCIMEMETNAGRQRPSYRDTSICIFLLGNVACYRCSTADTITRALTAESAGLRIALEVISSLGASHTYM